VDAFQAHRNVQSISGPRNDISLGNPYLPAISGESIGIRGSDPMSAGTRRSYLTQSHCNPYSTNLKAQVMRTANVALKPYDTYKYSNKLGTPAKAKPGSWVPSSKKKKKQWPPQVK